MALDSRHSCPPWTPLYLHRSMLRQYVEDQVPRFLQQLREAFPGETIRILDVGCGHMPYRLCFNAPDVQYHGADIAWAEVYPDVLIDPESGRIQAADETYHGVVHFQTMEHVPDAAAMLKECQRLLVHGGGLFCTVPFAFEFHPVPGDYRRWTVQGLQKELEMAGFAVQTTEAVEADLPSLISISELYLASRLGYVFTKPLFLLLNALGWLGRNSSKGLIPLTVAAKATKSLS